MSCHALLQNNAPGLKLSGVTDPPIVPEGKFHTFHLTSPSKEFLHLLLHCAPGQSSYKSFLVLVLDNVPPLARVSIVTATSGAMTVFTLSFLSPQGALSSYLLSESSESEFLEGLLPSEEDLELSIFSSFFVFLDRTSSSPLLLLLSKPLFNNKLELSFFSVFLEFSMGASSFLLVLLLDMLSDNLELFF